MVDTPNYTSFTISLVIYFRPTTDTSDEFTARYVVKGTDLGRTPLQFVATQKSGALVSSLPQEIQVFPPLRLEPRNITIITGGTIQVSATW